jgi:hypothetical protein
MRSASRGQAIAGIGMVDHYTAPGAHHIKADDVCAELRALQAQTKDIKE